VSRRGMYKNTKQHNETSETRRSKRGKMKTLAVPSFRCLCLFWWFRLFGPSRFGRFVGFGDFGLVVSVASLVSVVSVRWSHFVVISHRHAPRRWGSEVLHQMI